jgi:hypothetical protein
MPDRTTRSLEGTSPGYESAEEIHLKPHKAKVVVQKRSFKELVSPNRWPPSPAESDSTDDQIPAPSALTMEQRRLKRDISRGSPGDQITPSDAKTPDQRQLAKKRSQYYEDVFAYREPLSLARERVSRESMIMADIQTNVIVGGHHPLDDDVLTSPRFKTNTPLSRKCPTSSQLDINDLSHAS